MLFGEYIYLGKTTPIRYFLVDFLVETRYNRMYLISSSVGCVYDYGYLGIL